MRARPPLLLAFALMALACGGGRDPGPALDAALGPPGGPQLGAAFDVSALPASRLGDELGEVHPAGEELLGGTLMSKSVSVRDGVVQRVRLSASTPGDAGNTACFAVRDAVTALYGDGEGMGLPGVYPERYWSGEQVTLTWQRTGELGTDNYTCRLTYDTLP